MSQGAPETHAFEFQPGEGREETPVSADMAAFRRKTGAAETSPLRPGRTQGHAAEAEACLWRAETSARGCWKGLDGVGGPEETLNLVSLLLSPRW